MSDIKAGDLVMVVREKSCGCESLIPVGAPYVVARINPAGAKCEFCGDSDSNASFDRVDGVGAVGSRLIKIDPPPVAEDVPAVEELAA